MQKETDRRMSNIWLLASLLPIAIAIVFVGYFFISTIDLFSSIDISTPYYNYNEFNLGDRTVCIIIGFMGLINFGVSIGFICMLINRRHSHFKRQKVFAKDTVATITTIAKIKDVKMEAGFASIERAAREKIEENEKNAIFWAILSSLIPFIVIYVYYFLMSDFYKHERRENIFWENVSEALNELDIKFSTPQRTKAIPKRSFVLYLVLLIITSGLFVTYWTYILLKDPNEHFKYHIKVEKQLISAIDNSNITESE